MARHMTFRRRAEEVRAAIQALAAAEANWPTYAIRPDEFADAMALLGKILECVECEAEIDGVAVRNAR